MDYKRLKRLIGALMTAAAAFTLLWVLWGKDVQGIGLIAVAVLMAIGGLLHLFAPGEEPQSVVSKLVAEAKSAESETQKPKGLEPKAKAIAVPVKPTQLAKPAEKPAEKGAAKPDEQVSEKSPAKADPAKSGKDASSKNSSAKDAANTDSKA